MFWTLLLAHLLADYPLQTDWVAANKRSLPVLTVHVGTHLLVMAILAWSSLPLVWPYLLLVAVLHFGIDAFKNWFWAARPARVALPYLGDQCLHLLTLLLATWLIARNVGTDVLDYSRWPIYTIGFLLATHVWYISERVLSHADPAYQREVVTTWWPRMAVRALLLAGFLAVGGLLRSGQLLGLFLPFPYTSTTHPRRTLLIDTGVALAAALLILVASPQG